MSVPHVTAVEKNLMMLLGFVVPMAFWIWNLCHCLMERQNFPRIARLGAQPNQHARDAAKPAVHRLSIFMNGCGEDRDRGVGPASKAVKLLTTDVYKELAEEGWPVQPGDLGENVLLDCVSISELASGQRLRLGGKQKGAILMVTNSCESHPSDDGSVTDAILCSLPYVGDSKLAGFKDALQGRGGVYCKVTKEGTVQEDMRVAFLFEGGDDNDDAYHRYQKAVRQAAAGKLAKAGGQRSKTKAHTD